MDSKRKAAQANGPAPASEEEERAAKRRRLLETVDLTKGETPDTTTQYGLNFLDAIRRTSDKSGRRAATYFEHLLPRRGNEAYYKQTKMPISLETIEQKLNNREFASLGELENYCKRMITNAKEFYPRNSETFNDAERVRKAISNYMTKYNPAYKLIDGYQSFPTPLPPGAMALDAEEAGVDDGQDAEEGDADDGGEDAEGEPEDDAEDEDAEGEEDDDAEADEDDDDQVPTRGRKKGKVIVKRRGRPPKNGPSPEDDEEYEGRSYSSLSFQQAQEKIVQELIRKEDEGYSSPLFEIFINLPSRSLKDYYKVISEPLSLRKLEKMVKGVHGKNGATGVSDFKSWAAFEEKASLLWTNAWFYNEEGSEVYKLATQLQAAFKRELTQAKAAVAEPAQPKIRLKVGAAADQAAANKRITIHVGGRGGSDESSALLSGRDSQVPEPAPNGAPRTQLDQARASAASPSPSVQGLIKREESSRMSPAVANGAAPTSAGARPPTLHSRSSAHFQPALSVASSGLWDSEHRRPGKGIADALITNVVLHSQAPNQPESRLTRVLQALPTSMVQHVSFHLPPGHMSLQFFVKANDNLDDVQYKLCVLHDRQVIYPPRAAGLKLPRHTHLFEVALRPGTNTIDIQFVAAIRKNERVPDGPEAELEHFVLYLQLPKP